MFLKLKPGKQNKVISDAIATAGSERKLCNVLGLSKASLYRYKFELNNIREDTFNKILDFLALDRKNYEKDILEKLPDNWRQVKGGINSIKKKKSEGTFEDSINKLKLASSKRMKKWHKYMKVNFPKEYYTWQYERFKKIGGGYKYKLINGIFVRNNLEKLIGDFLVTHNFKFEYEPYVSINGKAYFPDFKIKNKLIEVTEWRHPTKDKLIKLKNKLRNYKKGGYSPLLFVPKNIRKFYKEIECLTISELDKLKLCLNASVA